MQACRRKDADEDRANPPIAGHPGQYQVIVILGRPPGWIPDDPTGQEPEGDSLVVIPSAGPPSATAAPAGVVVYGTGAEQIVFDTYVNAHGHLARLVARSIQAEGFAHARWKVLRGAHGFLSQLSVRFNIPIHIVTTKVMELATSNHQISVVWPYREISIADLDLRASNDERFYASLYREALNSNSQVYKFLCYFKIIEGLIVRRNRLAREARQQGQQIPVPNEVLPTHDGDVEKWLNSVFDTRLSWDLSQYVPMEARGRKVLYIVEHFLRPIRLGIAHAVLDSGEPTLMADEALHTGRVCYWLPLSQSLARRILKDAFPDDFRVAQSGGAGPGTHHLP